jgi:hypothetical protein
MLSFPVAAFDIAIFKLSDDTHEKLQKQPKLYLINIAALLKIF